MTVGTGAERGLYEMHWTRRNLQSCLGHALVSTNFGLLSYIYKRPLLGDEIVDAAKAGKVPILVKQPASFPYSTIFNPGNKISFSGPEMCPHTFQSQHFAGVEAGDEASAAAKSDLQPEEVWHFQESQRGVNDWNKLIQANTS